MEKIDKLIRLLESDNDSEALAALRAAKRELARSGKSWHDVADAVGSDGGGANTSAPHNVSVFAEAMAGGGEYEGTFQDREQARKMQQARGAAYCEHCGELLFYTQRRTRRFCSTRCRVAAYRATRSARQS